MQIMEEKVCFWIQLLLYRCPDDRDYFKLGSSWQFCLFLAEENWLCKQRFVGMQLPDGEPAGNTVGGPVL